MTEQEWLTGDEHPQLMVMALFDMGKVQRTKAGRRKLRLFGCGCCRLIWGRLADPRLRKAVEVAERFADGLATKEELLARRDEAFRLVVGNKMVFFTPDKPRARETTAGKMALETTDERPQSVAFAMTSYPLPLACEPGGVSAAEATLRDLLRCVFGNPFRPAKLDPVWLKWNGRAVVALAAGIYEERAFDRLPVLADALEDAGCADEAILGHLRGPGPHVRGCRVIDLILGKS